jgi:hypothetical protein
VAGAVQTKDRNPGGWHRARSTAFEKAHELLVAEERTRFARGGGVDVEVDAQLMHFI